MTQPERGSQDPADVHTELEQEPREGTPLDAYLPSARDAAPVAPAKPAPPAGLRSARLVHLSGRVAAVQLRGEDEVLEVPLDPDVDASVVEEALANGDRVMVEPDESGELVVAGVLRCRQPERVRIAASVVEIEAEQEVVLRSGRSAMRLREDGDVELVGSRISAASRGLFRLVGRMLRLN
ncbi:MAG: hypothetical protein U0271_23865 [Polyangiaceae bacterium]